MQECFYVILYFVTNEWTNEKICHILCEDGEFYRPGEVMDDPRKTPILFLSRKSARQAKKVYGHWPTYKILKIEDPSWLN